MADLACPCGSLLFFHHPVVTVHAFEDREVILGAVDDNTTPAGYVERLETYRSIKELQCVVCGLCYTRNQLIALGREGRG